MKELGVAIGTATGSIFGSLMGNKMQQDQFGNQLTLMKKQHEYNEASANAAQARAYEMWEKTNYAAQIEQMKKAGLSPGLMYGQAGAGGGTVSGAQGQGTNQPTDRSIAILFASAMVLVASAFASRFCASICFSCNPIACCCSATSTGLVFGAFG